MQNAGLGGQQQISLNDLKALIAQAAQGNNSQQAQSTTPQNNTSIFSKNAGMTDVNQSNNNSSGAGGVDNIFMGGGSVSAGADTTSIFSGTNNRAQYSLFSKKDRNYDVPKLTQENIANQQNSQGALRTNPKPYNIDMTPQENPYAAFRNPELQEPTLGETLSGAFDSLKNLLQGQGKQAT